MFKIVSAGETIGVCDEPRYIKIDPKNGMFVQASAEDAQGIALAGTPYNLPGHEEIMVEKVTIENEGEENESVTAEKIVAPEAYAVEVDGGEMQFETDNRVAAAEQANTDIQMALCEVYELVEGSMA